MIQTLTTPLGGPFLNKHQPPPFTPAGKLHFRRHKPCNALLHSTEAHNPTSCSFYEVLRVKRDATANEIKAAYRNLAKVYHPDCCDLEKYDGGKFVEIRDAYATLYDPVDRAMYDMKLGMGLRRRSGYYTSRRWETDQCW